MNSHNFDSDWDYYDWLEGNIEEEDESSPGWEMPYIDDMQDIVEEGWQSL